MAWVEIYDFSAAVLALIPPSTNSPGGPGPRGQDANRWHAGQGPPPADLGAEHDFYFQANGAFIWQKTVPCFGFPPRWFVLAKLPSSGPRGPQGIPGPPGRDGGGSGGGGSSSSSASSLPSWIDGKFFAETYPTVPNSMDDEFDAGSLNARWTWRNQSTATATFTKAGWITLAPPAQSTPNMRIIEQTLPSGDWEFTAKVSVEGVIADFCNGGLVLVDGTNGDLYRYALELNNTNGWLLTFQRWNSVTSINAVIGTARLAATNGGYMKVAYVSGTTTISCWFSHDGVGWARSHTAVDAVGITTIGLYVDEESNNGLTRLHCDYFRRTA